MILGVRGPPGEILAKKVQKGAQKLSPEPPLGEVIFAHFAKKEGKKGCQKNIKFQTPPMKAKKGHLGGFGHLK